MAVATVRPTDFDEAAKRACKTDMDNGKSVFPRVESGNLPYLCMDLVYQFTLLVDGFGQYSHFSCVWSNLRRSTATLILLYVNLFSLQALIHGKRLLW